jgi:uncharacterized protein YndB with AHSA1/START domain
MMARFSRGIMSQLRRDGKRLYNPPHLSHALRRTERRVSMKYFLVAIAILVGLILLVVIVGSLLPEKHTATAEASFRQPPSAVWQAITAYTKFPEWRGTVSRVQSLAPVNGNPSWIEYDRHDNAIPYEVIESVPPQRLVTRIADPKLTFGGNWTFEVTPTSTGSTLRITENGEVHNVIFRFMSRFVFGQRSTIDTYLRALGSKFGETFELKD